MSFLDPTTGLRTPLGISPQGVGQAQALSNIFARAGTPAFSPSPMPTGPKPFGPPTLNPLARMASDTRIGSQFARAAGGLATNPGANGMARFLAPGATLGKLASRAGVGAIAGQIGSGLIDRTNIGGQNSNWEQGLQGAALGAGVGAGVGSVVPVIGTGIGALLGGGIGAAGGVIGNLLGGGGGNEKRDAIAAIDNALKPTTRKELYAIADVDFETRAQINRAVDVQLALLKRQHDADRLTDDEYHAARAQLAVQIEQTVADYASNPPPPTTNVPTGELTPEQIVSMQMAIGKFMEPYAQSTISAGQQGANALRQLGAGPMADIAESGATRMARAYQAQAQMIPMMAQLQQQQSQWAQLAQQQQARQMSASSNPQATGGGDFEQMLATLGAAEG